MGKKKAGKTVEGTKDRTPLLPLSGTRKVVRTPTNPFEVAGDHYLVVWEGYPQQKDRSVQTGSPLHRLEPVPVNSI